MWDYVGDNYVHRIVQSRTDGKVVAKVVDWPRAGEVEEAEEEAGEEPGRAEGRSQRGEEHRGKKGKEEKREKYEDMDEELMQAIIESKLEMVRGVERGNKAKERWTGGRLHASTESNSLPGTMAI